MWEMLLHVQHEQHTALTLGKSGITKQKTLAKELQSSIEAFQFLPLRNHQKWPACLILKSFIIVFVILMFYKY